LCKMCRTVRGLIEATIPCATACRAKSALLQWVRCSPYALGSRQANCTIWARWRGGKPLRAAGAWGFRKDAVEAALLIATADAPNGGRIATRLPGHVLDAPPLSDVQEDLGMLDLEPGVRAAAGQGFQDRNIIDVQDQPARFSATHGKAPG